MDSVTARFRTWRRAIKAVLPFVRRREYLIVQRNHAELIEALDGLATSAATARLQTVKSLLPGQTGEVCFFVSFANQFKLKPHVVDHITCLLAAGIQVILILNTDLPASSFVIEKSLEDRLSGVLIRENLGFDFGAWAHAFSLCESRDRWTRLYLVNDSIVGPLSDAAFSRMIERVRSSSADIVGLTESFSPRRHLQSYFLVFNKRALHSDVVRKFFRRVLNWPSKSQVIEVYEVRITAMFEAAGLRCEALFPSLSQDVFGSDDTSQNWKTLVTAGFPYLKTRVIAKHSRDERMTTWLAARSGNSRSPSDEEF